MAAWELYKSILMNNSNLKLYYRFEETSGTSVTDSSGNSSTGTASRTNILNNSGGVYGYKGVFASASSDKITVTDNSILKPTTNFTIGAWINTSTTGTQKKIFSSWSANTNYAGIALDVVIGNTARLISAKNTGIAGTDFGATTGTINVCDGSWHHIVGTWDGITLRCYVDSKLDGSASWANAPVYAATNYVRVGCLNSTGTDFDFWNGSLDEVFLLNGTALSADQVKELYEGRFIGELYPQSNLVGLWHLNGNSTDSSGNSNNGTDTAITYGSSYGKMGTQGANFNGTTSYIDCGNGATLQITGSFTVMFWWKGSAATGILVGKGDWSSGTNAIWKVDAGLGNFYVRSTIPNTLSVGFTAKTDGLWHHYAFVFNSGSYLRVFIDGAQVGNTSTTDTTVNNPGTNPNLRIQRGYESRYNAGSIDEVTLFSKAFSNTEIRKWYAWSVGKYL